MAVYVFAYQVEGEVRVLVTAVYVDRPKTGSFGELARPCTWMPIAEQPNGSFGTGHALVRPRGRGRSCSS
jgi:hypothetical protein